ncbi:MAG: alpha/beta hydrolase [Flavobacteriales bacterium]
MRSDIRTLLLSGEFDPGTPPSHAYTAAKEMTNSLVVVAPSASHAVFYFSDCTSNLVRDFYNNTDEVVNLDCIQNSNDISFIVSDLKDELMKLQSSK